LRVDFSFALDHAQLLDKFGEGNVLGNLEGALARARDILDGTPQRIKEGLRS